jgi:hypothetical protein
MSQVPVAAETPKSAPKRRATRPVMPTSALKVRNKRGIIDRAAVQEEITAAVTAAGKPESARGSRRAPAERSWPS